jgi:hypothetical protein
MAPHAVSCCGVALLLLGSVAAIRTSTVQEQNAGCTMVCASSSARDATSMKGVHTSPTRIQACQCPYILFWAIVWQT